jgi:hypothetical protein
MTIIFCLTADFTIGKSEASPIIRKNINMLNTNQTISSCSLIASLSISPISIIGRIALSVCFILIVGCGGGSDDDDVQPTTNACSVLGLNARIINGTACTTAGSPVLALNIQARSGGGSLCSGTVITSNQILTAAHCFLGDNSFSVSVEVDGRTIFANGINVHPNFDVDSDQRLALNDVAVIDFPRDLGRPTVPFLISQSVNSGSIFSIFGYGLDEAGGVGTLESGEMKLDDRTDTHLIAEFEGVGSNTCNGDSGGPALFTPEGGGRSALIGVTSSGTLESCQAGDNSFFVNLQSPVVIDFIRRVAPRIEGI